MTVFCISKQLYCFHTPLDLGSVSLDSMCVSPDAAWFPVPDQPAPAAPLGGGPISNQAARRACVWARWLSGLCHESVHPWCVYCSKTLVASGGQVQAGRAKADRSLENSCTRKTPRARLQSPARYDNLRPEVVPCAGAYTAPCSDRDRVAGPQASTAFRMPEEGRPPPSLRWQESGPQRSPWRQAASLQRSPGLTLHAGGCKMCPLNWKKGNPRPGRKGDLPPMHQPVHQPPTWLTKRPHQFLFKLASGFSRVASTQREGGPVPPAAQGSLDKSPGHCRDTPSATRGRSPATTYQLH